MKLLKISDGGAFYRAADDEFATIDKITKDDLVRLVDLTLSRDVEFDEYDEETVRNQAQQIVYKSVVEKLEGLKQRKKEFTDESERLYLQEYDRYSEELSESDAGE
jgi:hypothetical protein